MVAHIKHGAYVATIVEEGAGLASLTFGGNDLVLSHEVGVTPPGYSGKVLVPWPNRIAGAAYEWDGEIKNLPVNEPETGAALHGLRALSDWEITEQSANSVTLQTTIEPTDGYPFFLESKATYTLTDDGLQVAVTTTNTGEEPAPYGASVHPYLSVGVPADECVMTVPATTVLEVDETMTPVAEVGVGEAGMDLTEGRSLDGLAIDHAFGGLPEEPWAVELLDPNTGRAVSLTGYDRWVQVYTGENQDRAGVAVEPMTCPPNAFNTGTDLVVLAPGEEHTFRIGIADTSK